VRLDGLPCGIEGTVGPVLSTVTGACTTVLPDVNTAVVPWTATL